MLSIIVMGTDSKSVGAAALKQLGEQDYPLDKIKEIVVQGGDASALPSSWKGVVRDFSTKDADDVDLTKEFGACSGTVLAFWGDDHVSPSHRLKTQVLAAAEGSASLLQQTWFYDPADSDWSKVTYWPTKDFQSFLESMNSSKPVGYAELMVTTDPLTLCAPKALLVDASQRVKFRGSPIEEIKLLYDHIAESKPRLLGDKELSWAAVRAPPSVTVFEAAKPAGALRKLAEFVWPKGVGGKERLDSVLMQIKDTKMAPAKAVDSLLHEALKKPLSDFEIKRVRKALAERLAELKDKESGPAVNDAIKELLSWEGLVRGKGNQQMARNFGLFWAAFVELRKYTTESADFWDMSSVGFVAEGLVRLGQRMWGTDERVNEAMTQLILQELNQKGDEELEEGELASKRISGDYFGALSLKSVLESMAYAALDIPVEKYPVNGLCSLAWALAEGNVLNQGVQMKVARGIIAEVDRMQPADVGKIFVAMEEKRWFKDQNTVAYLTESLMSRVRTLKKEDAGIAQMVAERQAEASEEVAKAQAAKTSR